MVKVFVVDGIKCRHCKDDIRDVLMTYSCIDDVVFFEDYLEIEMNEDMDDALLIENIENCGNYKVKRS